MTSGESFDADELLQIQQLQHRDLAAAQDRTRVWLATTLGSTVEDVVLRPLPTSINSFNGFAKINGNRLFFKTHTEADSALTEYYNSEILNDAGYNIVMPVRTEHQEGRQMLFYPVIEWPPMFDLMRAVERGEPCDVTFGQLIDAEERECARLLEIYANTKRQSTAREHAEAPVHQLFWHRLTGERFRKFYSDAGFVTNGGDVVEMAQILDAQWTVNGVEQPRSLAALVEEAKRVLDPAMAGVTVIGHGDAHFGNVFLENETEFLYFDPAFAGRHSPVLDIVKPLFHNVFAQWMYFPEEKRREVPIGVEISPGTINVRYAHAFGHLRKTLLDTKQRLLVDPLLESLGTEGDGDRTRQLQLALMCCPLLTMNLADSAKFPPPVNWLGLALAVQMGNWDVEQDFNFD